MKIKTTFSLLFFVLLLLSIGLCDIHAASETSPCTSYLTDYLNKVSVFETARDTLRRAHVARAKSIKQDVPPDYKELEDEYDSNQEAFFDKLKDGLSVHPGISENKSKILGILSEFLKTVPSVSSFKC